MSEEPLPARTPNGQFTAAGAAFYGRRGAAERERRFLERFIPLEKSRRKDRERLRRAIGVISYVYGPPWRPRRRARHELEMAPQIASAVRVLIDALDGEDSHSSLRAALIVFDLLFRREGLAAP